MKRTFWLTQLPSDQNDSPKSPETPEITEVTENFTKVTKYLTKLRYINKFCLGKISRYKTVTIKFSVDSGFSNKPYDEKRKHGNAGNQHQGFLNQKAPSVNALPLLQNC